MWSRKQSYTNGGWGKILEFLLSLLLSTKLRQLRLEFPAPFLSLRSQQTQLTFLSNCCTRLLQFPTSNLYNLCYLQWAFGPWPKFPCFSPDIDLVEEMSPINMFIMWECFLHMYRLIDLFLWLCFHWTEKYDGSISYCITWTNLKLISFISCSLLAAQLQCSNWRNALRKTC